MTDQCTTPRLGVTVFGWAPFGRSEVACPTPPRREPSPPPKPTYRSELLAPVLTQRTRQLAGIQLEVDDRPVAIAAPEGRGVSLRSMALNTPNQSLSAFDRTFGSECPRTQTAAGQTWRPRDLEPVRQGVRDTLPLLQCDNHPIRSISLVSNLHTNGRNTKAVCKKEEVLGIWLERDGTVHLTPDWDLRFTTIHEIGHAVLQSFDPRTCSRYTSHASPLVAEWRERMGWNADGTKLTNPHGNRPPTKYAASAVLEDMADSLATYLKDPASLRRVSPLRHAFFENLFATLRAARDTQVLARDERTQPLPERRRTGRT